ncbi:glycosyltransferase family 4 protein [Atopomonas sediminilitoris]|uniref:glycosyltransferase family 4 protein n=1 Tax=Atopomonas sediminilitoris TaxID=2919919 RepID=UPI001F4DCF84|nr:glycosyltransferase family 4 protein [Atopomonas sediminilitoris]MCJ8170311.1 glycosyltransferase family 4 protein [Atopomonas sediminilitoris]
MPKYLNVMWSADADFSSVHNVHAQISALLSNVDHCFLQGASRPEVASLFGQRVVFCNYAKSIVKGHGWRRLLASYHARIFMRQVSLEDHAHLIVDGIGCLRFLGHVLMNRPSLKAVVIFHGETRLSNADIKLAVRLAAQLKFIAVSVALAKSLEAQLGALVQAIPSVVTVDKIYSSTAALQGLGLSSEFTYVAVVGRLVSSKGVDYLLEAWAQAKMPPSYRLVYVGDGEMKVSLQARCEALALQQSVIFLGRVERAASWLRAFDWLVLPSLAEGQGLVVQEAVSAGVPVLCSDLPVFIEQLGTAGVYFAAGDVAELAIVLRGLSEMSAVMSSAQQCAALCLEEQRDYFVTSYCEVFN